MSLPNFERFLRNSADTKYLTKAKWFLSEKEEQPWDSFIVQQLFAYTKSNKEAFAIIILDTACYSKKPKLRSHAGAADTGEIIEKQKEIVSEWLISLKERGLPVILIGHHPLDDFTQASIKAIRKWYNSNLFVSYISADVHDSYDVLHTKIKNKDDKPLKEFNFGSTIDAPIEYGFLTMKENYNFETLRNFMTPFKNKHGKLDNLWINCTCSFGLFDHEMGKKIYLGDQASKLDKIINEVQAGKITNELKTSLHSLTKLRRYSEMFYVYRLIFEKSTHEKKDIILKHIDEAITILDKQKGSNGCVPRLIQLSYYLDGKKCRYFYEKIDGKSEEKWDFDIENNGLKNLQEMVLEIMNSPETTEELKKLIVCSALFAAEFDYPTKK